MNLARLPFDVLYEDNHLLALSKPASLPTMGTRSGESSLLSLAKEYIALKFNKPGNVYLGVVSRLDAPVTGVVLLARTSKAAARLSAAFRERRVEKTYWAIVAGSVEPQSASLENYLRKDERHRKVHVTHADCPDAQLARLSYERIAERKELSLLQISLETGRKHQIRVQLQKHGYPILGDRKYGSQQEFSAGIALHGVRVSLEHPVRREPVTIEAPLPKSWRQQHRTAALIDSVV